MPQVGIYDLDCHLILLDPKGIAHPADFNLKRSPSFGAEMGVEHTTRRLGVLRGWMGLNHAPNATATKASITSARAGVDMYWHVMEIGKMHLKLLTFGSFEDLKLSKEPPAAIEMVAITDLWYQLALVGAGAAATW
jgi:hypothetical protein